MTDWFTDWMIYFLLTDRSTHWLIYSQIDSLTDLLIDWFTIWSIYSLIQSDWFTHRLIYSLTDLLIDWFTDWFTLAALLINWFTGWLTCRLTDTDWLSWSLCCLMTPGFNKGIKSYITIFFSMFANHHIKHKATKQSGQSVWWLHRIMLVFFQRFVGMHGWTYSLYHHPDWFTNDWMTLYLTHMLNP